MSEAHERDVLILGGGASGALLAIQMLYASDSATRVTLVERSSGLGKGFAYGAAHPIHLLNVRASNMSAYPDDGDHFLAWLDRNGVGEEKPSGNAFHFVSRLTFGNYLESQLLDLAALPSNRGRFTRVDGEAVAISRTPEGIIVTLNNFRRTRWRRGCYRHRLRCAAAVKLSLCQGGVGQARSGNDQSDRQRSASRVGFVDDRPCSVTARGGLSRVGDRDLPARTAAGGSQVR